LNNPESVVDVVDETIIDLSCAIAGEAAAMRPAAASAMKMRRVVIIFLPV
jgi:hypothetical protein